MGGIVGVISFQKMFGLYGLKHHIVEISGDLTDAGRTNERQASDLGNAESRNNNIYSVNTTFQHFRKKELG